MALTYLNSKMIEEPVLLNTVSISSASISNLAGSNISTNNLTALEVYTNDINFPGVGGNIYNDTSIYGNLTITGSITALSGLQILSTTFSTTTALSVVNSGAGNALLVSQTTPSINSVADFRSNNTSILKVNNRTPDNSQPGVVIYYPSSGPALHVSNSVNSNTFVITSGNNVGIGTSTPTAQLEVIGTAKATNVSTLTGSFDHVVANTIRANTVDFNTYTANVLTSAISFGGKSLINATADSVAGWSWDSILTGQGNVTEIFLRNNGSQLYVTRGTDILQYSLTGEPWDITRVSPATTRLIPWDSGTTGIFISPDGTKFVTVGTTAAVNVLPGVLANQDRTWYATLSAPWDITSATLLSTLHLSATVAGQPASETAPTGVTFDSSGTIMYIVGSTLDNVQQFTLTIPYNVGTATYSKSLSLTDQETLPAGIQFNELGTSMYIIGSTGDDILEYRLSTAWDIATARFYNKVYIGDKEITPTALFVPSSDSVNFIFIAGSTTDAVQRYRRDTQVVSIVTETSSSNVDIYGDVTFKRLDPSVVGSILVDKNLRVTGTATYDSTLATASNITCGGDITVTGNDVLIGSATAAASLFSGITTGNLAIATSQTTGSITIGGTASTGNITIGQSTSTTGQNILLGLSGNRVVHGITPALSAGGTTQATAPTINSTITNITSGTGGVRLPTAIAGMHLIIRNGTASAVNVFPATGGFIDALAQNTAFPLASASTTNIFATTNTQWFTY